MKVLFLHQGFPGQFRSLAPALAARGDEVRALTLRKDAVENWEGVQVMRYPVQRNSTPNIHPWIVSFETQVIRAEACFNAGLRLKQEGFTPDIVLAHPGWGEALFIKEVWPEAKLGIHCEFYYAPVGRDVDFDPEFASDASAAACRMKIRNFPIDLIARDIDGGLAPTAWQAHTYPTEIQQKIAVIHEGVDTQVVVPRNNVRLNIPNGLGLTRAEEVITFVNRDLEPYRGYHIFMRALPELLKRRPKAQVLLIGGDKVSYGAAAPAGQSWKQIFIDEVRPRISDADWSRVHFLGSLAYESYLAALQISTVHVYLTYPFVLSWSLIEAMSAGCAIVASDTAPVREAITHGETGRLVDFFDVGGLTDEICALLDDPAERARLGRNARAAAIANYDLKTVCLPRQIAWVDRLAGLGAP